MPRPLVHALVAGSLALGTYAVTRNRGFAAAVLAAGTLHDGDHLLDYAIVRATKSRRWVVLPLHGWEYGVVLVLAGLRWPVSAVAGASYLTHLTMDHVYNGLGPRWGYSVLWRLSKGFDVTKMGFKVLPHAWADKPFWRWFH